MSNKAQPHSRASLIMKYIKENNLTYFCVSDFQFLQVSNRQVKSALDGLVGRKMLYKYDLEDASNRARVFYGTTKTPSKAGMSRLDATRKANYPVATDKLTGWREAFPEMFNPVIIKGNVTVHRQPMV